VSPGDSRPRSENTHAGAGAEAATAAEVTTAPKPAAPVTAATASSEGVSPNRRHTESDHCKHDTNFAQHDFLRCERNALVSVLPDAPRKTRVMVGLKGM
jgi:hypothetical protein